MSRWDDMDRKLAAATGRLLNSGVKWRPRLLRAGGRYTNGRSEPDPSRRVVSLRAIVTWRPNVVESGTDNTQGGVVAFDCVVDVALSEFMVPGSDPPEFNLPVKGDYFELEEEYEGNNLVQIARPGDDGSQRLLFYCTTPDSDQ